MTAIDRVKQETIDGIESGASGKSKKRIKIVEKLTFTKEMLALLPALVHTGEYHQQALYYAKQRAILKGRNASDVLHFDINNSSYYKNLFDSKFTFPTKTSAGFTTLNDKFEPTDLILPGDYKIVTLDTPDGTKIATDKDLGDVMGLLFDGLGEKSTDFVISTTSYGGSFELDSINFSEVDIEPSISEKLILVHPTSKRVVGFLAVIVEGSLQHKNFTSINNLTDGEFISSISEVPDEIFEDLLGDFFTNVVSDDLMKALSSISNASAPYDKINLSPMFPAMSLEVFEILDATYPSYMNWTMEILGEKLWSVNPKQKWNYKMRSPDLLNYPSAEIQEIDIEYFLEFISLIIEPIFFPASFGPANVPGDIYSSQVIDNKIYNSTWSYSSEALPSGLTYDNNTITNTGFSTITLVGGTTYELDGQTIFSKIGSLSLLVDDEYIITEEVKTGINESDKWASTDVLVNCGYNNIRALFDSDKIAKIKNIIDRIINLGNRTNSINNDQNNSDNEFFSKVLLVQESMNQVIDIFTLTDTTAYVQPSDSTSIWELFVTRIIDMNISDRTIELESYIGDIDSGYVKDVYGAVNLCINKTYGFFFEVLRAKESLGYLTQSIIDKRTYYTYLP